MYTYVKRFKICEYLKVAKLPWYTDQVVQKSSIVIWRDAVAARVGREPYDRPPATVAAAGERRRALVQQREHVERARAGLHCCPCSGTGLKKPARSILA